MIFNKFRRQGDDKLNMAHTLGLTALGLFDDLAADLELASELAEEHGNETVELIATLEEDRDAAYTASDRYAKAAFNIRGLVPSA